MLSVYRKLSEDLPNGCVGLSPPAYTCQQLYCRARKGGTNSCHLHPLPGKEGLGLMTMCCHWRPVCPILQASLTLEGPLSLRPPGEPDQRQRPTFKRFFQMAFYMAGKVFGKKRFLGYLHTLQGVGSEGLGLDGQ